MHCNVYFFFQVEFEARSPQECDFYGLVHLLKQMLRPASSGSHINVSDLADRIISQRAVGSVITQSPDDADDSDDEDDGVENAGVVANGGGGGNGAAADAAAGAAVAANGNGAAAAGNANGATNNEVRLILNLCKKIVKSDPFNLQPKALSSTSILDSPRGRHSFLLEVNASATTFY